MEDIQLFDFTVKSSIHDYEVNFITDLQTSLRSEVLQTDFAIVDQKVLELYGAQLNCLDSNQIIPIEASEKTKSYHGCGLVIETLIKKGFRKNHRLIAIGGGITQDVTAYISSVLYRGVKWIFFPTSLLAQGDSCIGSKSSINFKEYKNQIGGFYPPNQIFIYPDFVDTLTEWEIRSGLGEMCHYYVVSGNEDFDWLKKSYTDALRNRDVLSQVISKSLAIKKRYIEIDEFDQNERLVFNYGHSFGHAIESLTNYEIPHGIAVSHGMDIANFVSVQLGFIQPQVREHIRELLKRIWKGTSIKSLAIEEFKMALSKDKKNIGKTLRLILNKGIGNIVVHKIEMEKVAPILEEYFSKEAE